MAYARCAFYLPKDSSRAQLREAKDNLQRMLVQIRLTDDEPYAVEDGAAAVERLIARLADVPTPCGLTPRKLTQSTNSCRSPVLRSAPGRGVDPVSEFGSQIRTGATLRSGQTLLAVERTTVVDGGG